MVAHCYLRRGDFQTRVDLAALQRATAEAGEGMNGQAQQT